MSTISTSRPTAVLGDTVITKLRRGASGAVGPSIDTAPRPADRTTVVLVDPTSSDGETSLGAIGDVDTSVVVVVLRRGTASSALHEYSRAECLSVDEVAWRYLEQVGDRIRRPGRKIVEVLAAGPDAAHELYEAAIAHRADRVVFPASIGRLDRSAPSRLASSASLDIEVRSPAGVSGRPSMS
jgi:hypothetical protein